MYSRNITVVPELFLRGSVNSEEKKRIKFSYLLQHSVKLNSIYDLAMVNCLCFLCEKLTVIVA